ncbi:MAG: DNA-3-methyladenine glycosylase [Gemmatimonadetes bacterium]|nr:DNA-3-methyladenine glycosylase [Gemmatimonadota bacterium]
MASSLGDPLDPTSYEVGADELARRLLGCRLISLVGGTSTGGRIVEAEAYVGPHDPASHAAARVGHTVRNAPMFGPGGTAYVYFVYGMHWCFNVVAGRPGDPQAVLIRALESDLGIETMAARRGRSHDLTNGPARLCESLAIDGSLNEHPLWMPPVLLLGGEPVPEERIGVSGRIGIREAREWPLRFFLTGHPDVSKARSTALQL